MHGEEKFVYILVDEFQDINSLQYKILQMLAAPVNNLFIVGMMTSPSIISGAQDQRLC